ALVQNAALGEAWKYEIGIPDGTIVLGMVARWDPHKDHRTLLDALRHLNRNFSDAWVCVLAGRGLEESNQELAQLLDRSEVKDKVRLVGNQANVIPMMSALDLHILSSMTEGFPNVISEAMLCGVPCVTTDVGDSRFIVSETGWVVPPRDPESL